MFVNFVVDKKGKLTDMEVVKGLSPEYNAEAVRVVQLFQPWTPGFQNGQAVRVMHTIMVPFPPK
ncbi:energy transducer TonB [Hymenobacter busanensis]|uniref:energy transducer TonB n=1 Tax=Hymenobacter busanensis TaxID=2607656 RepID=UPI001366DE43|nr:hypothetical protein GUY19_18910 [Hymenobacter busanensis]